jgi:hypothetical protein
MIVLGVFLLLFGIQLLIAAYRLANPYWFIMTFFASNLIILISGALLAGFVAQMLKMRKESSRTHGDSVD